MRYRHAAAALLIVFVVSTLAQTCSMYAYERGCRAAGGKSIRHAFTVECRAPITITSTTRERLVKFLEFAHAWLVSIQAQVPEDGTPQRSAGLEQARLHAAEATKLAQELTK